MFNKKIQSLILVLIVIGIIVVAFLIKTTFSNNVDNNLVEDEIVNDDSTEDDQSDLKVKINNEDNLFELVTIDNLTYYYNETDKKIIYKNLDSKEYYYIAKPTDNDLFHFNSKPEISPDGKNMVYVSPFDFELDGDLYIYDFDKQENKLLVDVFKEKALTVKDLEWFDNDTLYLIIGTSTGTVSKGGSLYKYVISTNDLSLVKESFNISEEYTKIHWNEQYSELYVDSILWDSKFMEYIESTVKIDYLQLINKNDNLQSIFDSFEITDNPQTVYNTSNDFESSQGSELSINSNHKTWSNFTFEIFGEIGKIKYDFIKVGEKILVRQQDYQYKDTLDSEDAKITETYTLIETLSDLELNELYKTLLDYVNIKYAEDNIVGVWHDIQVIGAGYGSKYHFFKDYTFIYTTQGNDELLETHGTWKIQNQSLELKTNYDIVSVGGKVGEPPFSYLENYNVKRVNSNQGNIAVFPLNYAQASISPKMLFDFKYFYKLHTNPEIYTDNIYESENFKGNSYIINKKTTEKNSIEIEQIFGELEYDLEDDDLYIYLNSDNSFIYLNVIGEVTEFKISTYDLEAQAPADVLYQFDSIQNQTIYINVYLNCGGPTYAVSYHLDGKYYEYHNVDNTLGH